MSFRRPSSAACLLAVLCALLSCWSAASADSTDGCVVLLGASANLTDYQRTTHVGDGNIILTNVYYESTNVDAFSSFVFTYTVPSQRGLPSSSKMRFALYAPDPTSDSPVLIAQSEVVSLKDVIGRQKLTAEVKALAKPIQPNTRYLLAIWNEHQVRYYRNSNDVAPDIASLSYDARGAFPDPLPIPFPYRDPLLPPTFQGCSRSLMRNFAFTGFHGQRFLVKGQPQRVYNVLSLPSLQLNTRFISLVDGQAMNSSQQSNVRTKQSRLFTMLRTATGAANTLPSTVAWSHDGLYMGETAVQMAGHRLLLKPGAYVGGFQVAELDGVELAVSTKPTRLSEDGTAAVWRSSTGVVEVISKEVQFMLVNSDHFVNLHSATLNPLTADPQHIDGLLGQTAQPDFQVLQTAEFKERIESDFLLPASDSDIWSISSKHNQYVLPSEAATADAIGSSTDSVPSRR